MLGEKYSTKVELSSNNPHPIDSEKNVFIFIFDYFLVSSSGKNKDFAVAESTNK
jgi:hypothetical protein